MKKSNPLKKRNNLFEKVTVLFYSLIGLPVYLISSVVKKDRQLWLFSAQKGEVYAENSKYLFEYIYQFDKTVKPVWITKKKSIYKQLKEKKLPVVMAYSIRGMWLSMSAGCIFFSHFSRKKSDYNDFSISSATLRIQLWHGSPMKRIGLDDPTRTYIVNNSVWMKIIKSLFPFLANRWSCHYFLASSQCVATRLSSAFNLKEANIIYATYPKNIPWLSRIKNTKQIKKILFLPTWRSVKGEGIFWKDFDPEKLNNICKLRGIELTMKLHPYSKFDVDIRNYENLFKIGNVDIYEYIDQYDCLVTDYSSILFDYLLAKKTIIFIPIDIDYYKKEGEGFYFEYNEIALFNRVYSWREFEKLIENRIPDYNASSWVVSEKFNSYQGRHEAYILAFIKQALEQSHKNWSIANHYI